MRETPGITEASAMNRLFAPTTIPLGSGGTDGDRPCCLWTWRPPIAAPLGHSLETFHFPSSNSAGIIGLPPMGAVGNYFSRDLGPDLSAGKPVERFGQ